MKYMDIAEIKKKSRDANLTHILEIVVIESNHRIVDVVWSNRHLVMDDIPESMMASLTHAAVYALPLGYV